MTEAHTTIHSVHALKEQQSVATAKSINQALTSNDGSVIVFYSHPSIYVANKLQQGESGKQACNDWLKGINEALTAQRKNRRRVRLLCVQDALEHGSELNRQTELTAEQLSDYQVEVSDLELMAGHQLVLQNDDIMQLIERLEASTLQLSEQAYRVAVDVEAVVARASGASEKETSLTRELDELKQKHELTLKYAEEADKEQKEEVESLNEALDEANSTKEAGSKKLEQVTEELNNIKEENELLLLQLQQVQEELEKTYIEKQNLCKNNSVVESYKQRIEELESENQLLMGQVTRRAEPEAKQSEEPKVDPAQLKELEEENELLLLQLQQVQEELEAYFIKYQDAQKDLTKVKSEFEQMRGQKKKVKEQNDKITNENKKILAQLLATQEELADKTERAEQTTVSLREAEQDSKNYYEKFKQEQAKTEQFRDGLARVQQHLLELRLKETSKKPIAKSQKVKNKLLNVKKIDRCIPNWLNEQIQQVEHSPLFDKEWYLQQYPDLAKLDIDPAEHYVRYGGFENRNPGPNFDTKFYTRKYPDVLVEGMNPLLHYILHGEAEGRLPKAGQQW